MSINNSMKEYTGLGIYHIDLFRPSFKFMNKHFGSKSLVGLEIGTYKGINAEQILKNMKIEQLYLIDSYDNYPSYKEYQGTDLKKLYEKVIQKFKGKPVYIISDYSHRVKDSFNDETLDFVYIDGNHSYEYVKEDINNYFPKVRMGGVLSGHDINMTGVLRAVSEFVVKNKLKVFAEGQDWWLVKL